MKRIEQNKQNEKQNLNENNLEGLIEQAFREKATSIAEKRSIRARVAKNKK